jgi:hypothetical protein
MMKKIFIIPMIFLAVFTSCKNQDWEFADYDYQTVYFAYQYPVRTITLGDDIYSTTLDNEHKCKITAITGGVYENDNEITIGIQVDTTLCSGLLFESGGFEVKPMPSNYYSLASDQIVISSGSLTGGVEVQLTDAFFADSLALRNAYVIPLRMTSVTNADSMLSGDPLVDDPNPCVSSDWNVVPKNYILYAIKYINPWHGYYLRRGKDVITGKDGYTSLSKTIVRHEQYVEYDEVFKTTTLSMTQIKFPIAFQNSEGVDIDCTLVLTFDDDNNCTVSSASSSYTASGSGKFVTDGEKNSWGNTDRDAIYVNYVIDLDQMHISSVDTLVARNRGVTMETFSPVRY